jgi:hypothetical protein
MALFTQAELEEMRRADEEIEQSFVITREEVAASRKLDREAKARKKESGENPTPKKSAAERMAEYYRDNYEAISARNKKRYLENREEILARSKAYYRQHKDERSEYRKKRYVENKDRILAGTREYYKKNMDAVSERQKAYYQAHREQILQRQKAYRERKDG